MQVEECRISYDAFSVPALPSDVIRLILLKLHSIRDFCCAISCCKAWRHAGTQLTAQMNILKLRQREFEDQKAWKMEQKKQKKKKPALYSCWERWTCDQCLRDTEMILCCVFCFPCFCLAGGFIGGRSLREDDDNVRLALLSRDHVATVRVPSRANVAFKGRAKIDFTTSTTVCAWVEKFSASAIELPQARRWNELFSSEYASVSSFALLAQKLLSNGFPDEAVREALDSAKEEMSHANLCAAMARLYGGKFDQENTQKIVGETKHTISFDPESLYVNTFNDGAIGETIGSIECAKLADLAVGIEHEAWKSIAIEEAHHASFAWRTMWYLEDKYSVPRVHVSVMTRYRQILIALLVRGKRPTGMTQGKVEDIVMTILFDGVMM